MIGVARSSLQYRPVPRDDDALRLAIIRLAKQYGRYGYRKITELLQVEGWRVNHKKVERLWREEGLQLPQRHKRRKRLYHKDSSIIRLRPTHPNHVWAIDFVHDKLSNGRGYKMLIVAEPTALGREGLHLFSDLRIVRWAFARDRLRIDTDITFSIFSYFDEELFLSHNSFVATEIKAKKQSLGLNQQTSELLNWHHKAIVFFGG